jgi:hypothetical protein
VRSFIGSTVHVILLGSEMWKNNIGTDRMGIADENVD